MQTLDIRCQKSSIVHQLRGRSEYAASVDWIDVLEGFTIAAMLKV